MVDKQRKLPELLAPAGDMERLKMAVLYGADAVYLAGTDFGMRAFAGNFDPDELKAAVAYAHAHNVRVHCTINTMPRGDEIVRLPAHLERLNDAGVDAVTWRTWVPLRWRGNMPPTASATSPLRPAFPTMSLPTPGMIWALPG